MNKPKRPRDTNQLAKSIVDLATGEATEPKIDSLAAYASELGRRGGLVGGKARAEKLSKKKRVEIAKLGAQKRWKEKVRIVNSVSIEATSRTSRNTP